MTVLEIVTKLGTDDMAALLLEMLGLTFVSTGGDGQTLRGGGGRGSTYLLRRKTEGFALTVENAEVLDGTSALREVMGVLEIAEKEGVLTLNLTKVPGK